MLYLLNHKYSKNGSIVKCKCTILNNFSWDIFSNVIYPATWIFSHMIFQKSFKYADLVLK